MSELKDPKLRSAGAKRIGGSITYIGARNALLGFFGKNCRNRYIWSHWSFKTRK